MIIFHDLETKSTHSVFLSRAVVIFGLNALNGRKLLADGSASGAWDSTNAESLMRYTVKKNYTLYAWELGKSSTPTLVSTVLAYLKQIHSHFI